MKKIDIVSAALLIVGGLNWGLVAVANFDLVATIFGLDFGQTNAATRIVYGLVGLAAVYARLMSAAPNRARFLLESLADLRAGLRARGGDLVVRSGRPEAEVIRLATQTGAQTVFVAGDVSRYAARRQAALARECERHRLKLRVTPGLTVVPPGELRAAGGDHYKVFTPYWHAWRETRWRQTLAAPHTARLPPGVRAG